VALFNGGKIMIPVTQLRAGKTFQEEGVPFLVLKYEHTKMGRGKANIKIKVKNLKTNALAEKTYLSGARVEEISTTKRQLQYLYQDGENFFFMNPKTFEQYEVSAQVLENQAKFLQEGSLVDILFWEGTPLTMELPPKMKFKVAQTGPGVKGDSAANVYKEATLENGMKIKVPLFIKTGEEIWVDTRSGEYVERVK